MSVGVMDSILFKDQFSTEAMRNVFSDKNVIQKWLDVEAALAKVQAQLEMIPKEAAEEIERKADVNLVDFDLLKKELELTGHPFVPLIRVFKNICEGDAGEYIHWGATTQDMMDTAMVLQIREAYTLINEKILQLHSIVKKLAKQYKNLTVMGRTNGQHALPITFGFKFAVWLAEIERSMHRLEECKPRLFTGQFSGAVGTMASLGEKGAQVQALFLKELGLRIPEITWHASRDNLVEFASILGITAGTLGKIGNELYELQKPEFNEVYEAHGEKSVGSSTMPHKRNPFNVMQIDSLSRVIKATVNEAYHTMDSQHERDARVLSIEWDYISRICCMTDAALDKTIRSLSALKPEAEGIEKNLELLGDLISSERVMMKLSDAIGRQQAHDIIHEVSMKAIEEGTSLKETLLEKKEIREYFNEATLQSLLDPKNYTGRAAASVDDVTN